MDKVTEQDIRDFVQKTEPFLADLPLPEREAAQAQWSTELRRYLEAHPGLDFTAFKEALGGPRGAANLVRFQRQAPLNPAHRQAARYLLYIFAIGALCVALLIGALIWKFTPLFSVKDDRVQVLGGLIDIDGQLGQVKIGDNFEYSEPQFKNVFEGSYEVPLELVEDLSIEFDRGLIELSYTGESRLVWECKVAAEPSDGFIRQEKELLVVNLRSVGGTQCHFKIPQKLKNTVSGDSGKVEVIAPLNDTFVQLGNGTVVIGPDSEYSYRFDLTVGQGAVDRSLEALSTEDGIEIKVDLGNGSIQKK